MRGRARMPQLPALRADGDGAREALDRALRLGARARHVRLEADAVDVAAGGRHVPCDGAYDGTAIADLRYRLHETLAEGGLAEHPRRAVVLQGGGEDLGRARGALVDEQVGALAAAGVRPSAVGERRAADAALPPLRRDDRRVRIEEELRRLDAAREVAAWVASQVDQQRVGGADLLERGG